MKASKKNQPPLFPTLVKIKNAGSTGKSLKPDLSSGQSAGLRESKGFRAGNVIRKGRAGT